MIKIGDYDIPRYRNLNIDLNKLVAEDSEIVLASGRTEKAYIGDLHSIGVKIKMCSKTEAKAVIEATSPDLINVTYTDIDGTIKTGIFRREKLSAEMIRRIAGEPFYNLDFALEEEIS